MKPLLILLIGILPFQLSLAQSTDYFGTGRNTPAAPTPSPAVPSVAPLSPDPPPPELAAARARYEQEVKQVTAPVRARYAQTLEALKRTFGGNGNLPAALAVQQEIQLLGVAQNSLFSTPKEARVIIWNQHNAGHNNWGAKTLNLALSNGGKEVWRRNGIQIPWVAGEDTNVEVSVPYVPTDKLRVEVAEFAEKGGGLAEIEYWWDGRNRARKRPVTVSSVWDNSPKCGGDTLTDGITSSKDESVGYWSMPSKVTGWAEVSLSVGD